MKIGRDEMEINRILVIIDAQNDFITGALGSAAAEAVVPNIVSLIENFKGRIIATSDTHSLDYRSTQEGKNLPIFHCLEWTRGSFIQEDIFEAMQSHGEYTVVEKHTFGSPELLSTVPAWAPPIIEEIVMVGFATDICVIMNALLLKTYFPEILITVDASCCAGTTAERHIAALEVMRSCQINVLENY